MSIYFEITTKTKYLYASDIALQCRYIQFNATGTIVGSTGSSTASSFLIRIMPTTTNY